MKRFLIVGQGICGTLLSHALLRRGAGVLVVDDPQEAGSSLAASAIINPLGGRKLWRTRHMEQTLPPALAAYRALSAELGIPPPAEYRLLHFHESEERRDYFATRAAEDPVHLALATPGDHQLADPFFEHGLGFGIIRPYYQIAARALLAAWRKKLLAEGRLLEQRLDWGDVHFSEKSARWQGVEAETIIACDGAAARGESLFSHLKWTRNKGEALILSAPGLPAAALYQRGLRLAPWGDGLWWAGSRQVWDYEDARPSAAWRDEAATQLKAWLKIPFKIAGHLAAERPTVAGQLPVATMHPRLPALAVFNGMGTRGFANAPYYAEQLAGILTAT